jgi:hypothetical protein
MLHVYAAMADKECRLICGGRIALALVRTRG